MGNPGHRPLNKNEPTPDAGIPDRPKWLRGEGKKQWEKHVPELVRMGVLTPIDGELFATYCQIRGEYIISVRRGTPFTASMISQMRALGSSFGLEPSSRSRIAGKDKSKSSKWGDL